MDVSVIIVSWNTSAVLRGCLESILKETRDVAYEIIVIDNASHDDSVPMVQREFPQVKLISNSDNRGFAAANNEGLQIARGRYCLLLNPDTIVLQGAIQKTVAYADAHERAAVVGCQVLESPTVIQRTCFKFPSPLNTLLAVSGLARIFPHSRFFGRAQMTWWDRQDERAVDVVSGMFMLVRRTAMEEVGLMDEAYFIYAEEADWCYRFWQAGWRCLFTPCAQIIHLDGGSKSTSQVSVKMFVQLQKSLLRFHRKNLGVVPWACAKACYVVAMIPRALAGWLGAFLKPQSGWSQRARQSVAALKYHLLAVEYP